MFEGRKYVHQGGHKGSSIRFADNLSPPGVATTAYNHAMSAEERYEMARRITAALNLTSRFTVEGLEAACAKLEAREAAEGKRS
ncbi:hypothetical protein [Pseudomonas serbica]|uniref:hypothetical protein n=1 Tax=Pseudomonas serbica TaxID=2965074 RepID=UPI00237B180E|nr:hypothetical protein [Pseudomonas serbica]